MLDTWIQEVTIDMIPDGMCKEIAEKIGIKNLFEVLELVGGATFYFPKPETMLKGWRDEKIRKEYNGFNSFELSKKYNVSERWVRSIVENVNTDYTSGKRGDSVRKQK